MNPILAITKRNLLNFIRNKGRMIGSIAMAVFMMVAFSFLMKSFMTSGVEQSANYLISGVIIMTVFQTCINNSSDILSDIATGYMKEVMVAPVSRFEIALGNVLSGALIATLQGILVTLISFFLGFRVGIIQLILMVIIMFVSAITFSSIGLFIATAARNSTSFQTFSSMIMMPLTFVSGAYIPTTAMPKFLLPIVYLNPLTYVTSIFRYITIGIGTINMNEQIRQGIAFLIHGIVITPFMGLVIIVLIGVFFVQLCIRKFNKADFSAVKVAKAMGGGNPMN